MVFLKDPKGHKQTIDKLANVSPYALHVRHRENIFRRLLLELANQIGNPDKSGHLFA
jgi:hypothetical protein